VQGVRWMCAFGLRDLWYLFTRCLLLTSRGSSLLAAGWPL